MQKKFNLSKVIQQVLCAMALLLCFVAMPSHAYKADVLKVKVTKVAKNTYDFSVTVRHKDEGWKHYANKWEIVTLKGIILATRVLHHPHIHEQPFTRSLNGVKLPARVKTVKVRAKDIKHGDGGKEIIVKLP